MLDGFLVALIQGVTEFLPISSSGHLIILRAFLNISQHALVIDVAAHFGTLCAAIIYFRSTLSSCFFGFASFFVPRLGTAQQRTLVWLLIGASMFVVLAGALLFLSGLAFSFRTVAIVAWANLLFACLLFFADRQPQSKADLAQLDWKNISLIGLAQTAALIPGASRAGTVISMARFLGFTREASARIALLLAIPAILGATILTATQLKSSADLALAAFVAALSFVVALFVLAGFIRFSQNFSLTLFVVYRIALSILLFVLYWFS